MLFKDSPGDRLHNGSTDVNAGQPLIFIQKQNASQPNRAGTAGAGVGHQFLVGHQHKRIGFNAKAGVVTVAAMMCKIKQNASTIAFFQNHRCLRRK